MLPKKNRVDRKTIDKIFTKGRFCTSPNLTFKFIYDKDCPIPQISFTAPKNVSKSAVKRNMLRRRGYSVLENYLNILPKGLKGVFVFNKKSLEFFGGKKTKIFDPKQNLENEIKKIFAQVN